MCDFNEKGEVIHTRISETPMLCNLIDLKELFAPAGNNLRLYVVK